jgi:NAD(P)H dehydrogenase (quinone)
VALPLQKINDSLKKERNKNMKIGVTGATGHLGRLIIQELKEKTSADNIIALARSPQKAEDLGVEVRKFDYTKPALLADALKGINTLMLISSNEIGKRFEQHSHVIEAAKSAGIQWIVYTGLLHADASTLSLAGEHLATEEALKKLGIPFTILRNGWYTENFTNAILGSLTHGAIMGSAGEGKISAATRADFANAAAAVLTSTGHEGKIYELAGDSSFTMNDLAAEVSRQSGKTIVYKNMPMEEYAAALVSIGIPEGFAQFYAGADVSTSKGDLFDDGHQLSKLLARPTTPLAKAVGDILASASKAE